MHPSISVHDSSFASTATLPLTRENLMTFQDTMGQQKESIANEILQRYCHEIIVSRQQRSVTTPSSRERCQSTPPQHRDVVVASPRVLPFPYHNDSLFLPTAEQIQYHHLHSSVGSSSTSRADSSSIPPDSEYLISRPHSTTNMHSSSNYSLSSFLQPSERRSLPARLDKPSFTFSKSNTQQRFLRRSSFASNSTLSPPEDTKKPWLKRVIKFFHKGRKLKKHTTEENIDQVWYCQYSQNPSTRFENYYQQQQVISVS